MVFQFLCPQGHMLQADQSQVDQQCQCPHCGVEFLVPQPVETPAASPPQWTGSDTPESEESAPQSAEADSEQAFPEIHARRARRHRSRSGPAAASKPVADSAGAFVPLGSADVELLHIRCPAGHVLETPRDMLDEDVLCPFCQAQFHLRYQDSIEYQREKEAEIARHDARLGKTWLHWAIAIAVVVLIGLGMLIAAYAGRK